MKKRWRLSGGRQVGRCINGQGLGFSQKSLLVKVWGFRVLIRILVRVRVLGH